MLNNTSLKYLKMHSQMNNKSKYPFNYLYATIVMVRNKKNNTFSYCRLTFKIKVMYTITLIYNIKLTCK